LTSDNRSVLFGVCARNRASDSDFYTLCDLLDAAGGRAEAHIVWLLPEISPLEHRFSLRGERGAHRLYRMQATSRAGSTAFDSDFDNYVLKRFLQSFPLALTPGAIEGAQGTWME
jgi:hypothetical protein